MTDDQKHAIVAYTEIQLFRFLEKHADKFVNEPVIYEDIYDILDDLEETLDPSTVEACFTK
jgi:hypothetical protein